MQVGIAIIGLVLATGLLGCERRQPVAASPAESSPDSPAAPASAPAVMPAATTAPLTTSLATSQPTASLVNISDRTTVFPPARLRLESDGQHLVALLFTDDPKDALKDNYTGNSFYLRMELDVDDPEKLAEATWHYTAPSSGDREDSPYGIYLGGRKIQLQPFDVRGAFKVNDTQGTAVLISGQFQVVDDTAGKGPPQLVPVAAHLPVRVQIDRKKPSN